MNSSRFSGPQRVGIGARVVYDQQTYTIVMVGESKAVLQSDDGNSVEIALDTDRTVTVCDAALHVTAQGNSVS